MSESLRCQFEYLSNLNPKNIFVLGRNNFAILVSSYLDFEGFIDEETNEAEFLGKKIVKFSDLSSNSFVINCSTMRPLEAKRKIQEVTHHQIHVFTYLEMYSKTNATEKYWSEFRSDFASNPGEYANFESSLKDEISISTWAQIKHIRMFGEFLNLEEFPVSHGKHYFPDFLVLSEIGEVFYDIGCFDGETTLDFIEECKTYRRVYAFEPNPENFNLLTTKFNAHANIEIITKGVSETSSLLGFSGSKGSASHFDSNANLKIETVTLDSLLIDPPTFIKMDIEGMERFALRGGVQIISKHRPKLAISVYHLFDDVRVIFGLISEILPNSRYFLRHHSNGIHETVLYCIPN